MKFEVDTNGRYYVLSNPCSIKTNICGNHFATKCTMWQAFRMKCFGNLKNICLLLGTPHHATNFFVGRVAFVILFGIMDHFFKGNLSCCWQPTTSYHVAFVKFLQKNYAHDGYHDKWGGNHYYVTQHSTLPIFSLWHAFGGAAF